MGAYSGVPPGQSMQDNYIWNKLESITNMPNLMFHQNADRFSIQTKDHQEGTQIKTHTYTHANVNQMILSVSRDM